MHVMSLALSANVQCSALAASIIALVYRIRQYNEQDNTWNAGYTYVLWYVYRLALDQQKEAKLVFVQRG